MKARATGCALGTTLLFALGMASCGGSANGAPPGDPSRATSTPAAADEPSSNPGAADGAAADGDSAGAARAAGADTRTSEAITALVKAHRKEARECYEKGRKEVPGLQGDVVIHFTLKPSGKVKAAELNEAKSTIREAMVVSCVIDVISAIQFPKSSRGMESSLNYPFNFTP